MALLARDATPEDAAAIATIYNEGIEDRIATFETRLRSADELRPRLGGEHPAVVVVEDGAVVGFAWTSPTSARECYRRNLDFGVYVARAARGRGVGGEAMRALVTRAREAGFWKLTSGVFVDNAASRRMLAAVGFREIGVCEAHAQLDGAYRDVVLVEKIVGRVTPS